MIRFISKYAIGLPRSLTYILQASEYIIPEYLKWYFRVKDFRKVENRKKLVFTKKACLILTIFWILIIAAIALAVFLYYRITQTTLRLIIPLSIILATPHVIGYLILVPLLLIQLVFQRPIEYLIIKQAKGIIEKHKAFKIAIVGSFGKTSMKEILRTILSEKFKVGAPKNSHNTPLGISRFIKNLDGNEEILVFELGEYYPGDIARLSALVKPDVGIITGINQAHFQKFKDIKTTVKTIFEISSWVRDKNIYLNSENKLATKEAKKDFTLYNKDGCDPIKISSPTIDIKGTKFTMRKGNQKIETETRLLGAHQIGPLAAASSIADKLGMTLSQISKGIQRTKPFDHRLQPIIHTPGIITLDDTYNGNPDGVKAIIDFIEQLKGYRKIYVTPGLVEMGEKSEHIHNQIGLDLTKAQIDKVILIKNSVSSFIEEGLRRASYKGEIIYFDNAQEAYSSLIHLAKKGDLIILQNDWPDQYQ